MPEDSAGSVAPSQSSSSSDGTSNVHNVYMDRTPSHENGNRPVPAAHSDSEPNGNGAEKKEPSRYQRAKQQRQRQWEQFTRERDQTRAQLASEREQFQREKAEFEESKKPKRNYTLQDLQGYRQAWEKEGKFDLVEAADHEIAQMQQEEAAKFNNQRLPVMGTAEHRVQWEQAERELAETDPDFMREGTALDNELRALMSGPDGNLYRQHPRGIVAAYHRAKMSLLERENSGLKQELQRYQGYTSIGGGAPGSRPSGSRVESLGDFSKLSSKDMKKHLLSSIGRGTPFI